MAGLARFRRTGRRRHVGPAGALTGAALFGMGGFTWAHIVHTSMINALASVPELFRDFRARAVLTPHPGEFRLLAVGLGISLDPTVPGSRPGAAEALAQRLGCIVVLKGAGTIVSDGHRTWTCQRGHACLGTAGTGDVLGGVIAALASQFSRDGDTGGPGPSRAGGPLPGRLSLFDAARVGVQAHAVAGELWARRHASQAGLLASELAELIPETLERTTLGEAVPGRIVNLEVDVIAKYVEKLMPNRPEVAR